MSKKPTAFVTGATGFIGSHLVRELLDKSFNIHILYRPTTTSIRLNDILHKTTPYNIDISDKNQLQKLLRKIQPDYIFHLANIGIYGGKESFDEDVVNVNLLGTITLLQASKDIPYKLFINTGSSSEYGLKNKKMREIDSCFPESTYGITKLASTLYAKNFAQKNNKPVLTLRLFSPFGSYDDPHRFISTVITQALTNKKITLTHPKNVRDFIYIDDVIDAYMKAMTYREKLSGEIINIGSGKQYTTQEVTAIISKLTKTNSKIIEDHSAIKYESPVWQADITKAKKLLAWRPATDLETGLKRTIVWYQSL